MNGCGERGVGVLDDEDELAGAGRGAGPGEVGGLVRALGGVLVGDRAAGGEGRAGDSEDAGAGQGVLMGRDLPVAGVDAGEGGPERMLDQLAGCAQFLGDGFGDGRHRGSSGVRVGPSQSKYRARMTAPLDDPVVGRPPLPLGRVDPLGEPDVVLEQGDHLPAEGVGPEGDRQLAVVLDAAVVEVGRPDDARVGVDDHRLGVQDDVLPLVDLDAVGHEPVVEAAGGDDQQQHVPAAGEHEAGRGRRGRRPCTARQ